MDFSSFLMGLFFFSNKTLSRTSSRWFVLNQTDHPRCLFSQFKIYGIPIVSAVSAHGWQASPCSAGARRQAFRTKRLRSLSVKNMFNCQIRRFGHFTQRTGRPNVGAWHWTWTSTADGWRPSATTRWRHTGARGRNAIICRAPSAGYRIRPGTLSRVNTIRNDPSTSGRTARQSPWNNP